MSEVAQRAEVVRLARKWVGTPYLSNAMVLGAGIDCAMLLVAVYREAGLLPEDFDPRPYPPHWHLHQGEERYKNITEQFAEEVSAPPERAPLGGDVILFRIGRLFAHGAIITDWPKVVHARAPGRCWEEDISKDSFGKHALWRLEQKFYSRWAV